MQMEQIMLKRKFLYFDFVKAGTFYLGQNNYLIQNKDKSISREWKNPTQIRFYHNSIVNAECSTYLVCLGGQFKEEHILYVGEYTNSLGKRWLIKHNQPSTKQDEWVSWHSDNLDNNLNKLLHVIHRQKTLSEVVWDARTESKKQAIASKIEKCLTQIQYANDEPILSLWLTYDPWVGMPNGSKINISRSIEQIFLESDLPLPLNTKGRAKPPKNVLPVKEVFDYVQS